MFWWPIKDLLFPIELYILIIKRCGRLLIQAARSSSNLWECGIHLFSYSRSNGSYLYSLFIFITLFTSVTLIWIFICFIPVSSRLSLVRVPVYQQRYMHTKWIHINHPHTLQRSAWEEGVSSLYASWEEDPFVPQTGYSYHRTTIQAPFTRYVFIYIYIYIVITG